MLQLFETFDSVRPSITIKAGMLGYIILKEMPKCEYFNSDLYIY